MRFEIRSSLCEKDISSLAHSLDPDHGFLRSVKADIICII